MTDLFDFDQKNLVDIEIVNSVPGRLLLNAGQYVPPTTTIRLSEIPMTLESFRKSLPISSLPAYVRDGSVVLNAITLDQPKLMPKSKIAQMVAISEDENTFEDTTAVGAPILKINNPLTENSFTDETNEAALSLQPENGPSKNVSIKLPKATKPAASKAATPKTIDPDIEV